MNAQDGAPRKLREQISARMAPVKALPRPWRRALPFAPVGVALLLIVPRPLGIREDSAALGAGLLWAPTLLELVFGLVVIGAALRESIPGRGLTWPVLVAGLAAWCALAGGTTALCWQASHVSVSARNALFFWRICFGTPTLVGIPLVLIAWLLATRAFPVRPVLTGALCGWGAGLMVDSAWRLTCEASQPSHVVAAHYSAVAALTLLGALLGRLRLTAESRRLGAFRSSP
jgi:hypothetical protein